MSGEIFSIERLHRALMDQAHAGRWSPMAERPPERTRPAEFVLQLPTSDHAEGVAADRTGSLYVSNRRFVGSLREAEILKLSSEGAVSVLAKLPAAADPRGNGVLGLATDCQGDVFAALDSRDPSTRGVWRIRSDGSTAERIAGSERMSFPNALTFDAKGNLYATDSETGTIWRFPLPHSNRPAPWTRQEALAPFPFDPFGIPLPTGGLQPITLPGANGIAFYPPNHLYVANTEKGLIVEVPIERDGSAGPARILAGEPVPSDPRDWIPDPRLWTIDGIAVDAAGQIHGVIPAFPVLSGLTGLRISPLIRIDSVSGEVTSILTRADAFHTPVSLAFGRGEWDRQSVYVTNAALFSELFPGPGSGLVRAEIGVVGFEVDECSNKGNEN